VINSRLFFFSNWTEVYGEQ